MIERGGHYTRHYNTPAAIPPEPSIKATLISLWHKLKGTRPEGRRRIIPGMPCDNHALGWSEPAYPPNWHGGKISE